MQPKIIRRGWTNIIEIEDVGAVTIVTFLFKRILNEDGIIIGIIGEQFRDLIENQEKKLILVDWSNVELCSGAGLGKLIDLHFGCKKAGGKLVMCKVCKEIMEVFEITKLDKLFKIYDDVSTAKAALESLAAPYARGEVF